MAQRMSAAQAGYMELPGAKKGGDCRKVEVPGGVSLELGCCNEFEHDGKSAKEFKCGTCEYRLMTAKGSTMLAIIKNRKARK